MKLAEITNSLSSLNKDYKTTLASNEMGQSSNDLLNSNGNNEGSFSNLLKKSLNEVNESQIQGYNAMEEIATGKVQNLQKAVQKIQEAELTLKLALEVKNKAKALGAYKQIMAMQV